MDNYKKGQVAYDKKDYVQAVSFWKPLAERGNLLAIRSMAASYFTWGLNDACFKEDYNQALYYFRLGALQSDVYCIERLGHSYNSGLGIKKNILKARKYYLQAIERGNICAAHYLAMTYYYDDYRPDYNEAFYWLNYSAKHSDGSSHYFLSDMYLNGHRGEVNYVEAYKHYVLFSKDAEDCIFAVDLKERITEDAKPMHIHQAKHLAKEFQRKYY
jgi:uncharacterized protein